MIDEKKKMTAQDSSVGADDGQPLRNSTENSISAFDEEINGDFQNNSESLDEIYRRIQRLTDPHYLHTISMTELYQTAYQSRPPIIDGLLYAGAYILAGAPKIGKSWLALWLCLCAAQGKPLWTFATRPCEVLYPCLEDSFQRIQSRLFDLTEDAPPTLHFAVMSQQLHNGLVEQIEQFLKEHPQTKLIVIDTLQRIRTVGNDANPYASDYRDIGVLKALADKYRIAILLVHHLRKMNDDDPMNMISGTTGLSGATDSNFVLRKSQRRENTATLYCTGRDIPYRELALEFDGEDHVWKLLSDDC